jgi:OTU domain-containing protein 3
MAKKQRGKTGRAKSSAAPNPNKRAERQTRKALRVQARRGKNYSDKELKSFNRALADSGLVLREMTGDGNCFFRAISDQLEGNQHNHATYRARVCGHMEEMREFYAPFIEDEDETFNEYMTRMRSDCEWVSFSVCTLVDFGTALPAAAITVCTLSALSVLPELQAGQPELQAMATVCNVDIMVHQFEAPSYVVSGSTSGKMIHVSYHDGQHYNSVHPTAAVAAGLARPTAPRVVQCAELDGDKTVEAVYARALSALDIQQPLMVPSSRALAIVASAMDDMGGDSDAAHEFLLVDPQFAAACLAQPEPEPEPEPGPRSRVQTGLAGVDESWDLDEQEKFELGIVSFGKEL